MTTGLTRVAAAPLLRLNRNFNLLWLGEGVSVLGNATTSILLPLLAITGFGAGPGWMGALTAAAWLPWLVIGLPAGAWVDHLESRRVMIIADLVAASALSSIPLAWLLDVLTLPHLIVVALLNGGCAVFFRTAYVKLIADVVEPVNLEQANARLYGTESAMQVVGPGLGGIMAQVLTTAGGLVLDAVSFVVSAVCLMRIRPTSPQRAEESAIEPFGARIRAGIAYVARDRYLRTLTVIGGVSNFGLTGYATLLVLFLVEDLQLRPSLVGTVLMLGSLGGLLGAFLARRISQRWGSGRASTALMIGAGPPALLVPLAGPGWNVAWLVAGLFLVGVFVVAGNVVRAAWRQQYVPPLLMGRVITTSQMVNFGSMPVAGVVAGILGETLGLRATIALMALTHAIACISVLATQLRSLRELPLYPDGDHHR